MIKKPNNAKHACHSFGNISGDKIPIQMLQKLYRHSFYYHHNRFISQTFLNQDTMTLLDSEVNFRNYSVIRT